MKRQLTAAFVAALALAGTFIGPAHGLTGPQLSDSDRQALSQAYKRMLSKEKGPYTSNYCVCADGAREPVQRPDGSLRNVCERTRFCAAFREPWVAAFTDRGMYIGNIFSSDLLDWDSFPSHQDLVRGYVLEKFYTDTHPTHKLAELRAYGGLMGAEYEARDMLTFFERFVGDPDYNDFQDYLLAFELQKRYFVRNDQGAIQQVRNLASNIRQMDESFKPLRDATHNQLSASLVPRMAAYRDRLPRRKKEERAAITELMEAIDKLTSLDQSALAPQLKALDDKALASKFAKRLPRDRRTPITAMEQVGAIMAESRQAVAAGRVQPADARRLIGINLTAAAVMQNLGSKVLDRDGPSTVGLSLRMLKALIDGAYGTGLLSGREREAAVDTIDKLQARKTWQRDEFLAQLSSLSRVIEWGHNSALAAFAEVWAPWTYLLPDVAHVGDDIVRGSPLLLYGETLTRLDDHVTGQARLQHQVFGKAFDSGVRALNPGLALGELRVAPAEGDYQRDQVVALPQTPADLEPAAGIITQGEGNVVSHVQLLARALGIPNAVMASQPFAALTPHDGQQVFFIATPQGRVYLKQVLAMTASDKAIYDEYNRNEQRSGDGSLGGGGAKLHVDPQRLDLKTTLPIDLKKMRRRDSGVRSGPKAAFLGELKHLFPDHVARGIVIPFGAYYAHNRGAEVVVPDELKGRGIARDGASLYGFEQATYHAFFNERVPAGTDEKALGDWIRPRLAVIRHSLRSNRLSPELEKAIRDGLAANDLLRRDDPKRTVGCFVRSDTNVEDQDNFNGAGLNLTLFNLDSLDDIYEGLKEVWASPFAYRSFSWRQTVIDQPMWVLPSVVILESVPNDKSGVLVTADIETGEQGKMLIATSEGVGGAVDGTPAETLLWSPQGVELQQVFRSPYRKMLDPDGGSRVMFSTGRDHVLEPVELKALVAAAQHIEKSLKPARDPSGRPRPWDIEYGFSKGKLWLFQVRPFVGNEELKNIPALASLDAGSRALRGSVSLSDKIN